MNRRLAAIMMADLAGYSALMEENAPAAIARVRHMRETALEPLVEASGGRVEKRMGDGWLITFSSAMAAVEVAQAVQKGLAGNEGLRLRLAVHLGEIVEEDGELYGSGINVSARLQAQAPPGGLIVSADCHRQLDPELGEVFADAGTFELKNVKTPVACFMWRPGAETRAGRDDLPVIAVMPFAAAPATADVLEAASDLNEQITHRMSQRTGLRVMQTESAEGEHSEATYFLRGRLRVGGATAKAILSLVRGDNAQVFWSETFEGESGDLFAFSDRVSDLAMNALRVQINAFDAQRFEHLEESALTPSELRARAAQHFHKGYLSNIHEAARLLDRALVLDPDHPTSLSMMCISKMWTYFLVHQAPPEAEALWIVEAADKAVRGAPRSYFMFFARALVRLLLNEDPVAARQDAERAMQLNPGYNWGLETLGLIALSEGDYLGAVSHFEEMVQQSRTDPLLPRRLFWLAFARTMAGNLDAAQGPIEQALETLPDCAPYWRLLAHIHERRGQDGAAATARARAEAADWRPSVYFVAIRMPPEGEKLLCQLSPGPENKK